MSSRLYILAASIVLAAAAGCYTGSAVDANSSTTATKPSTTSTSGSPTKTTSSSSSSGGTGTTNTITEASGLPCDVAVLIKTSCGDCHGNPPSGGAPNSIVTYDDLTAKSLSDPTKTVAELALSRMKSTSRPMPPDGSLGTAEIAILGNWISAGMPKGSCNATPPKSGDDDDDAGSSGSSGSTSGDAAPPPPTSVCTSGVTADPNKYGPPMKPGEACLNCHTGDDAPQFGVAGTVYPTAHEPDDCNGIDGTGASTGQNSDITQVLIIDATGTMRAFPVNASGNFYGGVGIATPYRAMVVRGNSIRQMQSTQTTGDCNSCHTEQGVGAPGRVMEP